MDHDPQQTLVVRERDANGKPTAFGWTPIDVLDEPPNLDNIRPDWKALLKIIPAYKEYKEIAASLHNRYDQSMAQRKLVEDPDARYLRAKIWTLKCKGEYEMGNFDRLPKDEMVHLLYLLCPIGQIFHPISIVTREDQKERRRKRKELVDAGLPCSESDIVEAIEKEKADKRARGERVTGVASISFGQASIVAKEHEKYSKNLPAAAPRARTKRTQTRE